MLVCDLCLLNPAILAISGLSGVLGTLGWILLSYPVHMHSRLRSLRRRQVHVGPITWEVLPQLLHRPASCHGGYTLLSPSLHSHCVVAFLVLVQLRLGLPCPIPGYVDSCKFSTNGPTSDGP
jgi:hypothetical protein